MTIAAISTSNVSAAIGMIRISGKDCIFISSKILSKNGTYLDEKFFKQNVRKAIFCDLVLDDSIFDHVIVIYYQKPYSYTGEDLIELSLHGNIILLKKTLSKIFSLGAIPAERGEFTKKAFLNQKLDLNYAEAIHRLIGAKTEFELKIAQRNMSGEISRVSSNIRSKLISLKAECEAEVDFSTEDLTYQSLDDRKNSIYDLQIFCKDLISKTKKINHYIDSMKVVLYGEPNTGKSSLMNELLGKNRSIVSSIEGTTRDYISEKLHLEDISIELVDTAGIRFSQNEIESLGIQKGKQEFKKSHLCLYIIDSSEEINMSLLEDELNLVDCCIVVANKVDINHSNWEKNKLEILKLYELAEISCKTKYGLEDLQKKIYQKLNQNYLLNSNEDFVFLEERNISYIENIVLHLEKTLQLISQAAPVEIYIKEIDECLEYIGKLSGKIEKEEIFGRIFSNFCVGK